MLLAPDGVTAQPAALLAAQLQLRLLAWSIPAEQDPALTLAALAQEAPGWLLPLPLDPGADLALPGCWADALAAWRQPALLLLPAAAANGGLPRAYHALLAMAGVPLLGLLQWGLPWSAEPRRRDGLPWLGCLAAGDQSPALADDPAAMAWPLLLRRRWAALQRSQA